MRFLEVPRADLGRRNLRGDREHGYAGSVTIEQAVDQVQIARPAAPGADRELTRQMRLGTRCEGCDFFVPDMHPLYLPLAAKRVRQPVQAVADNAVNPLDTCCSEGFRKLISHRFCHGLVPFRQKKVGYAPKKLRTNGKLGQLTFVKSGELVCDPALVLPKTTFRLSSSAASTTSRCWFRRYQGHGILPPLSRASGSENRHNGMVS